MTNMKPSKEEWINKVADSIAHINRAEAPAFLFTRIEEQLNKRNEMFLHWPVISFSLAGLALLFTLNIVLLKEASYRKIDNSSYQSTIYSLTGTDYNLY